MICRQQTDFSNYYSCLHLLIHTVPLRSRLKWLEEGNLMKLMSRPATKPTMWLCAQRRIRSADQPGHPHEEPTHWAHSEDSDQTWQMPRLIGVFAGCTVILLVLSWGGSILFVIPTKLAVWYIMNYYQSVLIFTVNTWHYLIIYIIAFSQSSILNLKMQQTKLQDLLIKRMKLMKHSPGSAKIKDHRTTSAQAGSRRKGNAQEPVQSNSTSCPRYQTG